MPIELQAIELSPHFAPGERAVVIMIDTAGLGDNLPPKIRSLSTAPARSFWRLRAVSPNSATPATGASSANGRHAGDFVALVNRQRRRPALFGRPAVARADGGAQLQCGGQWRCALATIASNTPSR